MFGGPQTEVPSPRQVLPFALAALLGLLSVLLPGPPTDWSIYAIAAALNVALVAAALVLTRLPRARLLVGLVPLGYVLVVALLRHSSIGAASGYQPLFLLSVVWLALFGSRGQLGLGIAAVAVAQLVPLALYGAPRYPETALRSALLWVAVGGLTGIVVQQLVYETRAGRDRFSALLAAATGTAIIATDPQGVIRPVQPRRGADARLRRGGGDRPGDAAAAPRSTGVAERGRAGRRARDRGVRRRGAARSRRASGRTSRRTESACGCRSQ